MSYLFKRRPDIKTAAAVILVRARFPLSTEGADKEECEVDTQLAGWPSSPILPCFLNPLRQERIPRRVRFILVFIGKIYFCVSHIKNGVNRFIIEFEPMLVDMKLTFN